MNTSVLYFTLALICIWIVMSQFYEDKYITQFFIKMVPNAEDKGWI